MRLSLKAVFGVTSVVLAALASTSIAGAADTVVRVGSATGASGQEVTVRLETVSVADPGLGAFTIDVAFNPDVVSAVSCDTDPSNVLDTITCNKGYGPSSVRVNGFKMTNGLTGDTPLADITFKLSGNDGDCSDLTINVSELTDPGANDLSAQTENGTLCISEASSASSTPGSGSQTTPRATSSTGTAGPNGQQPSGTLAPGETPGTAAPGQTNGTPQPGQRPPGSSGASGTAAAATSQGGESGGAAAKTTPGAATGKGATQASSESSSGGGAKGWLIGIGVVVAAVIVVGAGIMAWRRRASRL